MTQLLLFDTFSANSTPIVPPRRDSNSNVTGRRSARECATPASEAARSVVAQGPTAGVAAQSLTSMPLYDPQRNEIHHIGDLAKLVLARYELVARRREILRRRRLAESGR